MSILVISNHPHLVSCMRTLFEHWGETSVFDVTNETQCLNFIQQTRKSIRIVLLDGDVSGVNLGSIVDALAARTNSTVPLIGWIRPSNRRMAKHLPRSPLIHFQLKRPFGESALINAIFEASEAARLQRSELVYICDESVRPREFPKRFADDLSVWTKVHFVHRIQDLEEKLPDILPRLAAIVVDPVNLEHRAFAWIRSFRKAYTAQGVTLVCLGREPEKVLPLRTECHVFLKPPQTASDWEQALAIIARRSLLLFEVELRTQAARYHQKRGDLKQALHQGELLIRRAPDSEQPQILVGEIEKSYGHRQIASAHFMRALEINPCLPGAYIQALTVSESLHQSREISAQALKYCPKSPEIQAMTRIPEAH